MRNNVLSYLLLPLFAFLRAHLPHRRFGPANSVTLLRAGIVCVHMDAIPTVDAGRTRGGNGH